MNSRAFSNLEILISLLILAPVMCGVTQMLHHQAKTYRIIKDHADSQTNILKFLLRIEKIMADIDLHTLPIFPIIHKNSKIEFSDGSINPIMTAHGNKKPDQKSDAITSARFNLYSTQTVLSQTTSQAGIETYSCMRFGNYWNQSGVHSFIGIVGSSSKLIELTGKLSRTTSSDKYPGKYCYQGSLKQEKSMLFSSNLLLEGEVINFLIPIDDLYTLYLDRQHVLHYLGHSGQSNIENQPIIQNLKQINFDSQYLVSNQIFCLRSMISSKKPHPYALVKCNHLGREDLLTFSLNRP